MKTFLVKNYESTKTPARYILPTEPLWTLKITELTGHNVESKGRVVVNRLLKEGWVLLHIYNLRYEKNGVLNERPMAILGKSEPFNISTVPGWLNNE